MRAGTDDIGLAAARLVRIQILQPSEERMILACAERARTGQDYKHRQVQHIPVAVSRHLGLDFDGAWNRRR